MRKAVYMFFIVAGCTLLSGCATTLSSSAYRIIEADEMMVKDCNFVGQVHGTSGWGNLAASVGIQNAKNGALEKAAKSGATHVYWTDIRGGYAPYVNGRAYNCSK